MLAGLRECRSARQTRRCVAAPRLGSNPASLPKPRESTAISEVLRDGELAAEPIDLQRLLMVPVDFARYSGR